MNRRTLLSSALAALSAWLMPWRKKAKPLTYMGVPVVYARDMEADQAELIPPSDDLRWTNQVHWYEEP